MNYICKKCKKSISTEGQILPGYPKEIHSGFADQGYLYCDTCPDILVFSTYDETYRTLVGKKQPWMLTRKEQEVIENHLIKCSCGGNFTFKAQPRCPYCNTEIPDITPLKGTEKRSIYYVVLGNLIDGEKTVVWKAK